MRRNHLLLSLLSALLFFTSCQKEYSLELSGTRSSGSLQKDGGTGECLPKTVEGVFEAGTPIDGATSYIDVQVNVTNIGTYRIYSDTLNGFYFDSKGSFTSTGLVTIRVPGNGTPANPGIQNFVVRYDTTMCVVSVPVLPAGTAVDAVYTLVGSPATCTDFTIAGNYIRGIPLTNTNTVDVKVNVTSIGKYTISTAESNGMSFSGSGVFTATGEQTVTLTGTGTPAVANATPFGIEGTSTCGFTVNVTEGAAYTIDCAAVNVNGTYEQGKALTGANTIGIVVDVTTPGPYSISATGGGMTFTGSGNFANAGAGQVVTLSGTGTPTSAGAINIQIAGACAFALTVAPGTAPSDLKWKFTAGGVTYEGPTSAVITIPDPLGGAGESTAIFGETTNGDLDFTITVFRNGPMQAGTFTTAAMPPANWATFLISNATTAQPVFTGMFGSGTSLSIVLTTYNETTRVVEGTFTGTVKDANNATVTISGGTFKAEIP
jgi:hypothetical protein